MVMMVIWEDDRCCTLEDYHLAYKEIMPDNYLVYDSEEFGRFPTYDEVYKAYEKDGVLDDML